MNTTERRRFTPEQLEAERLYTLKYRAENRERLAKKAAERRAAGKAKPTSHYRQNATPDQKAAEAAQKRKHYQETREQQLAYAAKYREENHDRLRDQWTGDYQRRKEYFDRYNRENYSRLRARRLAWSAANADRIKALNAAWTQNNLERHRLYQHKRRARLKAGGELSPNIIEVLLVRQKGRCACCSERLKGAYHLDHIFPLALGGSNTDDNVQLLTPRCNWQKGAKHPIEFMQQRRGMLL